MQILVLAGYTRSLILFRGSLLEELIRCGHEVVACGPEIELKTIARLKELGIVFRAVELDRTGMNPAKDLCSCFKLVKLFREERPDVILCYTAKSVIYGSIAAKLARVPRSFSIVTGLGYAFMEATSRQRWVNRLVCLLYKLALACNRAVFFQNPDDLDMFAGRHLVAKKKAFLLSGSGVALDYYTPAPLPPNSPIFLLIARLLRDKGVVEYVGAAEILRKRYPQAVFRLLGPFDSNPTAIQEKAIEEWVASGVIEYLGETEDVRPFLAGAGVYVLPSYREGTPRSVLEAMAMGRPIVTTDAPGCRETVVEGENGFLVPVKDTLALADAMEKFLVDPDLIAKMGKRSREIAEEKYDVRKVNACIMKTMGLGYAKGR